MNLWWRWLVAAIAGIAIGVAGTMLFTPGTRQGVVDLNRILSESKQSKSLQDQLNKKGEAFRDELAKISDPEKRSARSAQLNAEFTNLQQEYRNKVLTSADTVINRLAKESHLTAVFTKDTVRYANVDLTSRVLTEMDK